MPDKDFDISDIIEELTPHGRESYLPDFDIEADESEHFNPDKYIEDFDVDEDEYRQLRMQEIVDNNWLKGDERADHLAEYLYYKYHDDERYADWDIEDWEAYIET